MSISDSDPDFYTSRFQKSPRKYIKYMSQLARDCKVMGDRNS